MKFDRNWIASHIPHQGSMCLLDEVDSWDESQIVCRTRRHLDAENPLRMDESLGICNGIEFAAQAMAVHGALLTDSADRPQAGFLTSVRDVGWHCTRLDQLETELSVKAERISGSGQNLLYHFSLYAADTLLLSGRASVMVNADDLKP